MSTSASLLAELEKSALAGDPTARLVLEHPITEILLKELMESPVPAYIRFDVPHSNLIKDGKRRLIAGYASVQMIDKQNELVTIPALHNALARLESAGEKYANINLEHSNITIGKILLKERVKDSSGGEHWTHVDEKGLYVVCELRDDIEIADKVWEMANKGELNAFSIGGRALKKGLAQEGGHTFWKIDDLELYEITVCKRGKNTLSGFEVLKSYLENGLITEEAYLQKSAELKKSEKLIKELAFLPNLMGKSFVIRKDFICQVGSTVEKGEGHDFDLLVKMDSENPLRRHVETRLLKALPPELWSQVEFVFGDEGGPHDTYRPLYDLALVPVENMNKVDMSKTDTASSTASETAPTTASPSITVKSVEKRNSAEDEKMSKVEKTIGTPELTGTGTGPATGGASGTSTEGPDISRLRAKVKEAEAELEAALKAAPTPPPEPAKIKEAGKTKPEEEKAETKKPYPDEKEGAEKPDEDDDDQEKAKKTKYPYPDEKEAGGKYPKPDDEKEAAKKTKGKDEEEEEEAEAELEESASVAEVMAVLAPLEAKGKIPPGLKRWMEEHRKSDPRVEALNKKVDGLSTKMDELLKELKVVKAEAAQGAVELLKSQSTTVRKSVATPSVSPEGEAGKPTTLADIHKLPWAQIDEIGMRQRASFTERS
jgi:HK97 family phage prohead protease